MKQRGVSTLVTVASIALVLVAVVQCNSRQPVQTEAGPPNHAPAARMACAQFLQRLSRAPSSFEAIEQPSWITLENSDGSWYVLAHYRAQNGFGGINVEKTTCVMTRAGDNWTLKSHARMQ